MVRISRATITTVVAAAVLVGLSLAAPSATADPPGLVKTGATSASNSFDKAVTAGCPAGTVVSGGGGYLTAPAAPHQGYVALDQLEPLDNGSGFVSRMREVTPDPNNWQLSTDALCITKPAGWDVVPLTGPLNTQIVTVSCGSKNVIGMGGRINNGNGDVILDTVQPAANLKSVTVRGTVVPGTFAVGWSVTAFAVCANVPNLQLITPAVPLSHLVHKSISASCPAGTGLYSVGADISPGSGQMFLSLVHAISIHSLSVGADEDLSGYGPMWALFGYGICGP